MTKQAQMLAVCAANMGFSMLSSTFSFYYVKVFLNHYHIQEGWFHLSQVLYLIWNAVNDPLFAYCQDTSSSKLTRTRRESILYTAPLFSLSYLLAWFSIGGESWMVGLHLIITLCLYDTMFTFIGLAMCCLFTEVAITQSERITLTRYSKIASLLGSSSIYFCEFFSQSLNNFRGFQLTTVGIAVGSCLLMTYAGKYAHTEYDVQKMKKWKIVEATEITHGKDTIYSYWRLTWQVLSNRNFLAFVISNFLQEFHITYLANFTAIICDQLIKESDVPRSVRSTFYGSMSILPAFLVIFGTPLVARVGYFKIIQITFVWKIVSGLLLFLFIGPHHPWILMGYILCDRGFASAAFSLFNMPLSDIADRDKEKYHRKHHMTSMVFGTNALVVKPAISLSPMLVVSILNSYGYADLEKNTLSPQQLESLKGTMFQFVWGLPIVIGILQCISWSFYTLRKPEKEIEMYVE